ncbi:hypothetical protein [Chryseobacterium foetidum]|uniref:hypothetical protein n=1 Tax=Chryseobacterium foetidum TaxID=2951057 RepID=UPI0021C84BF0|nr:hypothetical protein [Chryseobacterium foetidum]
MKIGDRAKVDPKFTGLETWVEGTVIDTEKNPFKGIVIAIKDALGRFFLVKKNFLSF